MATSTFLRFKDPLACTESNKIRTNMPTQEDAICCLLDTGSMTLLQLFELFGIDSVYRAVQNFVSPLEDELDFDLEERRRRKKGRLAMALLIQSPSTEINRLFDADGQAQTSLLVDTALEFLKDDDPDDPSLYDPIQMLRMKDPVMISTGYVFDRSTVLLGYEDEPSLRMASCPYSRQKLTLPVIDCVALKTRIKEWENERTKDCLSVLSRMIESEKWEYANNVVGITESYLSDRKNAFLQKQLSILELQIPGIQTDAKRMVKIRQRLQNYDDLFLAICRFRLGGELVVEGKEGSAEGDAAVPVPIAGRDRTGRGRRSSRVQGDGVVIPHWSRRRLDLMEAIAARGSGEHRGGGRSPERERGHTE